MTKTHNIEIINDGRYLVGVIDGILIKCQTAIEIINELDGMTEVKISFKVPTANIKFSNNEKEAK